MLIKPKAQERRMAENKETIQKEEVARESKRDAV